MTVIYACCAIKETKKQKLMFLQQQGENSSTLLS